MAVILFHSILIKNRPFIVKWTVMSHLAKYKL